MALESALVSEFHSIWKSTGIPHAPDLSIWAPIVPTGYYFVGHVAILGYEEPAAVRVYSAPSEPLLLPAEGNADFIHIWNDSKIGPAQDTAIWYVKPTQNEYIPLGHLASQSGGYAPPDVSHFAFVHQSLVELVDYAEDVKDLTTSSDWQICHFWQFYKEQYLSFVCGRPGNIHVPPDHWFKLRENTQEEASTG